MDGLYVWHRTLSPCGRETELLSTMLAAPLGSVVWRIVAQVCKYLQWCSVRLLALDKLKRLLPNIFKHTHGALNDAYL